MRDLLAEAEDVIARCRRLASYTDEPGYTTRTFLSEATQRVHEDLGGWMRNAGLSVLVDAAGNLRGRISPARDAPVLFIGSHLDTVLRAGAFDGILGVVLGVKLVEIIESPLRFAVEILGFSEEEGVRFGFPFIGSRAFVGDLDAEVFARADANGISVANAIRNFGLDPDRIEQAAMPTDTRVLGYVEFHIEQGPVLESLDQPLGIVDAIAGQSRLEIIFEGQAGHAGTTPMHLRRDALAGAAEWITAVERDAHGVRDLVATVGRIEAQPGATNVIPAKVIVSFDIRHRDDAIRIAACERIIESGREIADRRRLCFKAATRLEQPAVAMDADLRRMLACAVERSGLRAPLLSSGAGHDAMIVARRMPAAILFLRSPRGLSHNPDESVLTGDVAAALSAGLNFLELMEARV